MKKPLAIILGLIVLAVLGGQTYMIYNLQQHLRQLTVKESPAGNTEGRQTLPNAFDDNLFDHDTWDPYQEMQRMQSHMEQLFGNAMSRYHMNKGFGAFTKMPALDLKEEPNRYVVSMDIPGADTSSLTINLEGRQLSVSMHTERKEDDNGQHFQRRERFTGTFQRSLTLPGPVKESAMTSDYKDGVLTIAIPKA